MVGGVGVDFVGVVVVVVGVFAVRGRIGEEGVGVGEQVFEHFEQIDKEVLVDQVSVFGQAFEHRADEVRSPGFEHAEISHEHQLQRLGLHSVALFMADRGVGFFEFFCDGFAFFEDLALFFGAEFPFLGGFLFGGGGFVDVGLGGFRGEFGEEAEVE